MIQTRMTVRQLEAQLVGMGLDLPTACRWVESHTGVIITARDVRRYDREKNALSRPMTALFMLAIDKMKGDSHGQSV